jgi:hypothetical protein
VALAHGARPGDTFTIAVLGCDSPFAKPLGGVFIRYAILGIEIFTGSLPIGKQAAVPYRLGVLKPVPAPCQRGLHLHLLG